MYDLNKIDPVTYLNRKESKSFNYNNGYKIGDALTAIEENIIILNSIEENWDNNSEVIKIIDGAVQTANSNSSCLLEIYKDLNPNNFKAVFDNMLDCANRIIASIKDKKIDEAKWIYKSHFVPLYLGFYDVARYANLIEPFEDEIKNRHERQFALCDKLLKQPKQPIDEMKETDIELSIFVVAYNKLELTKLCIESIKEYTKDINYELIVVDNGSSDGTFEYFENQDNIKFIRLKYNVGLILAIQSVITSGVLNGKFWAYLNNDVFVTKNWAQNLLACIKSDPSIAIVLPVTDNAAPVFQISVPFLTTPEFSLKYKNCPFDETKKAKQENLRQMFEFAKHYNIPNPDKWRDVTITYPFTAIMRPSSRLIFGMMDDPFTFISNFYYSDADGSIRLAYSGNKQMICEDCFVHHEDSATAGNISKEKHKMLIQGSEIIYKKYEFFPMETEKCDKLFLSLINKNFDNEVKILYYEPKFCNEAVYVKSLIKSLGADSIILDVISNNNEFDKIRNIIADKVIKAVDVDDINLKLREGFYDIIIAGDNVSDICNLTDIIELFYSKLKKGGIFLSQVKNKSGFRIIDNLLNFKENKLEKLRLSNFHIISFEKYIRCLNEFGFDLEKVIETKFPPDYKLVELYKDLMTLFDELGDEYKKDRDYLSVDYWCIKAVKP